MHHTARAGTRPRLILLRALLALTATGVFASAAGAGVPTTPSFTGVPVDPYRSSEPWQCDPVAKPGVLGFQKLILDANPQTSSAGIIRPCEDGGESDHHAGRAWDWHIDPNDPARVAEADEVAAWLLATVDGQQHMRFRRFGLTYMIWNDRIWSTSTKSWEPYKTCPGGGGDTYCHRDHIHFSFSDAGAAKATTWWQGGLPVAAGLLGDWVADERADLSVFRASDRTWHAKSSAGVTTVAFGSANEAGVAVHGDYTGDGKLDAALYRPADRSWHIRGITAAGGFAFGALGDVPAPADYDGDGTTDVAVYRPSNRTWYVQQQNTPLGTAFGAANSGEIPVPADYTGDGKADMAVYRPDRTWHVRGLTPSGGVAFGLAGDIPVPADYTGDGKADMAVYRPSDGRWYIQGVNLPGGTAFGRSTDVPVPADFTGDGKAEITVYRPADRTFFIKGVNDTTGGAVFGLVGDKPVSSFVYDRQFLDRFGLL